MTVIPLRYQHKLEDPSYPTYYKWSVRLRIDTPEIKGKRKMKRSYCCKRCLSNKILNKKILLKNIKYDKYGEASRCIF